MRHLHRIGYLDSILYQSNFVYHKIRLILTIKQKI